MHVSSSGSSTPLVPTGATESRVSCHGHGRARNPTSMGLSLPDALVCTREPWGDRSPNPVASARSPQALRHGRGLPQAPRVTLCPGGPPGALPELLQPVQGWGSPAPCAAGARTLPVLAPRCVNSGTGQRGTKLGGRAGATYLCKLEKKAAFSLPCIISEGGSWVSSDSASGTFLTKMLDLTS